MLTIRKNLYLLVLCILISSQAYGASRFNDRFPKDTYLVVYDNAHSRVYYADDDYIREIHTQQAYQTPGSPFSLQSITVSPNGKGIIVRGFYSSVYLNASNLKQIRLLIGAHAWWDGNRIQCFYREDSIVINDHKYSTKIGKTELIAVTTNGDYFLGIRKIKNGTEDNGMIDTYREELWQYVHNRFKRKRILCYNALIDPGSTGIPSRLSVMNNGAMIAYGMTIGGGIGDYLCVYNNRLRKNYAHLKNRKHVDLIFIDTPIVTSNSIIGIAGALAFKHNKYEYDHYYYRIKQNRIFLRPISEDVRFITYDSKRGVGFGVLENDGISVKFHQH